MANNNNNGNGRREQDGWSTAGAVFAGILGVGAAATGIYYLTKNNSSEEVTTSSMILDEDPRPRRHNPAFHQSEPSVSPQGPISDFTSLLDRAITHYMNSGIEAQSGRGRVTVAPDSPKITNLNSLLSDIYVRYIALKDDEFDYYYDIFNQIFYNLHQKMKQVDPYYNRYSSTVQFAGSHYDGLRINKPDEFDMDVVIGLPLNMYTDHLNQNDIDIEPKDPGFVQLKMGVQYQKLPYRDSQDWHINKTAYKWKDDNSEYLLRSKFTDWFKSVVAKALNEFECNASCLPIYKVDGVVYTIRRSESGPAFTLIIENVAKNFKLDVDLVPALRFPEVRWPVSGDYREIPHYCKRDFWMVVPKPNKSACVSDQSRSWRIALHNQERDLMHDSNNLRPTIRLMKKFRDVQGMHKIASYYIKTLFYWEILERNNATFWQQNEAKLFRIMLNKFYDAMVKGKIPYLWNEENNLIEGVNRTTLNLYAAKIKQLIDELNTIDLVPTMYTNVAKYLLTKGEYQEYYYKYLCKV